MTDTEKELAEALMEMWRFASALVERHGTEGYDTLTRTEHQEWQDAAGAANHVLHKLGITL
jgi:hypothetical protein